MGLDSDELWGSLGSGRVEREDTVQSGSCPGVRHPLWHHADRYWVSDFSAHSLWQGPSLCPAATSVEGENTGPADKSVCNTHALGAGHVRLNPVKVLTFGCRIYPNQLYCENICPLTVYGLSVLIIYTEL